MDKPHLDRSMGLLQATATNIISMVGVGPFLTIPFMVQAMNGPHILYAWLAASDSPDLDDLVGATGISRRQVERKCNALYGAPPKLLARKYRALRAAVALASGDASLDEVIDRGFYDQSHLIREVKHFTGLTPRQFALAAAS